MVRCGLAVRTTTRRLFCPRRASVSAPFRRWFSFINSQHASSARSAARAPAMSSACELSLPSVITAFANFSKASLSSEAASFRLWTRRQWRYGFIASTKSSHKTSA